MGDEIFNKEQIKEQFQSAQLAGADGLLVHVRHDEVDLESIRFRRIGTEHFFIRDIFAKDTLVITSLQDCSSLFAAFGRGKKPRIGGIYDLKKPFDSARVSTDIFPMSDQVKLDSLAILHDSDRSYSWWDQLRERWGYRRKPQIPTFEAI